MAPEVGRTAAVDEGAATELEDSTIELGHTIEVGIKGSRLEVQSKLG